MTTPLRATLLIGAILCGGMTAGALAGSTAVEHARSPYEHLDTFARVLATIQRDYAHELDNDVLIDAAIRGMVRELDAHSRWLSPDENRSLKKGTASLVEGIGLEVEQEPDGITIVEVHEASPAARQGLLVGDRILQIDGEPTTDWSSRDAVEALLGPRGTPVTLLVARSDWPEPQSFRIVRDRVVIRPVSVERLGPGEVYVRLIHFSDRAARDLVQSVGSTMGKEELKGLVLDLRDNGGGLLEQAVAITDLFVDSGVIVTTAQRRQGDRRYEATTESVYKNARLVVLVNGESASASEIVAAALQDTGRAILVGTETYGKGSIQRIYENADESALKLTTGIYLTPSGKPVADREGRVPDHVVPFTAPRASATEAVLERIESLDLPPDEREALAEMVQELPVDGRTTETAKINWRSPFADRLVTDPQLAQAIRVLRSSD